jgi:hypothetical protein
MATIDQLSAALVKADAAGDTEGARILAGEIRKMRETAPVQKPVEEKSMLGALGGALGQGVGNVALGAQNLVGMGLEKLGADQVGQWLKKDAAQGKAKLKGEIQPYEEQYPITVGGGRLAGEVVGTLPVGGALAKGVGMAAKGVGATKYAAPLVDALRTGGMSAAGQTGAKALATRVAGGAATGGASGALASGDLEGAGTGAMVGGALPLAGKVIQGAGKLAKTAIGGSTGVGEEALTQALRAGKEGGKLADDFTKAMRGESSMDDVLAMAKQNLEAMGQQKQAAYRQGMAGIKSDKTVLNLANVDQAVNDAIGMATFKGQIKNEKAAQALSQIKGEIDNWKSLDPAQFHTPEGLDALKQKIGGILEDIPFEQKTARTAAGKVYDSLRGEISKQAPEYSKVMKGYSEASETIKEIERALSQGDKAMADTASRKLQSLMRNNVNTNYGQRAKLANEMIAAGGQDFMPALAGHALNDFMPRGSQRAGVGTGGAGLALTGNIPAAAGLAAMSSPRLMGEAFYGAGKAAGAVNPAIIEALRKAGYKAAPIASIQEGQ